MPDKCNGVTSNHPQFASVVMARGGVQSVANKHSLDGLSSSEAHLRCFREAGKDGGSVGQKQVAGESPESHCVTPPYRHIGIQKACHVPQGRLFGTRGPVLPASSRCSFSLKASG